MQIYKNNLSNKKICFIVAFFATAIAIISNVVPSASAQLTVRLNCTTQNLVPFANIVLNCSIAGADNLIPQSPNSPNMPVCQFVMVGPNDNLFCPPGIPNTVPGFQCPMSPTIICD